MPGRRGPWIFLITEYRIILLTTQHDLLAGWFSNSWRCCQINVSMKPILLKLKVISQILMRKNLLTGLVFPFHSGLLYTSNSQSLKDLKIPRIPRNRSS